MRKQKTLDIKELTEKDYVITGLSARQKAERIIKRLKGNYHAGDAIHDICNSYGFKYLFSENCELTWEQKDFVICCAFSKLREMNDSHRRSWIGSSYGDSFSDTMVNAFERWGIIDALKLYNNDEKAGFKWFESHKIPMQHVYRIINDDFFKYILRKYPELKLLPTKYNHYKCEDSINEFGRVSVQQYETLLKQSIDLLKNGDYDKSHYDLFRVIGPERSNTQNKELYNTLHKQVFHIKTKEDLLHYLELLRDFGWINDFFGWWGMGNKELDYMLKLLGVKEEETNINNFDLKNSKDIARCKELFPLAFYYPFLFVEWYPGDHGKYSVNMPPVFVPDDDNWLEKKRKELHFKLAAKGVLGKILSKTIVPNKLGKTGKKLEQNIADRIYKKKQPGRGIR